MITDSIIGPMDPFIGTPTQTHRMRAFCKIYVNGFDITNNIEPYLISVRCLDGSPEQLCELEIDDRDAKVPIPPILAPVTVALGWQSESMITIFEGLIKDVEHGFGRKEGGRRMWVTASGMNMSAGMKTPIQDQLGKGAPPGKQEGEKNPMSKWVKQIAQHGGVETNISGAFGSIERDLWHAANASPMHTITELGEKFGFVHQYSKGTQLDIEKPGERGLSCRAIWRDNLIAWRVRPFAARPTAAGGKQQWFDAQKSQWQGMAQKFGLQGPWNLTQSLTQPQGPEANENNAAQDNQGAQESADISFGNGRIVINGEPNARWNSKVLLVGARPGVDGLYTIVVAEHVYSRQGYITFLEVSPDASAPAGQNVNRGWLPKPAPNIG